MRTVLTILIIFVCLNLNAQKEKNFTSRWRQNPSAELKLTNPEYFSANKGNLLYYLSNDEENIYIDMKIPETVEQNRILKYGLTVWIDREGKTHKKTGIKFPIGTQFSRGPGRGGAENNPLNQATPLSQANTIELIGFTNIEPRRFPSNNKDNIRGLVKYDNEGNLLYSLIIPLSKLPSFPNNPDKEPALLALAIEYGALPATGGQFGPPAANVGSSAGGGRSGGRPSGGSRGGSGGGGGQGGGMPAGGGGGGGGYAASIPNPGKPVLVWMKNISLASNK